MEMLVALGLFSMIVATGMDIYLLAGRAQRKVFTLERLQSDARYAMEAMTREVRTGAIDFAYYVGRGTPLALPDSELALISSDNSRLRFHKSTTTDQSYCADATSVPCLLVTVDDGTPAAITPKGVTVTSLGFYVAPNVDPFTFGATGWSSNVQPHVTIVVSLRSVGGRIGETQDIFLQTTATSRTYRR
jgi:hypothetical protein